MDSKGMIEASSFNRNLGKDKQHPKNTEHEQTTEVPSTLTTWILRLAANKVSTTKNERLSKTPTPAARQRIVPRPHYTRHHIQKLRIRAARVDPAIIYRPALNLARNKSFTMTLGRLAIAFIGLLATPVYTRILTTSEYATYTLTISIATFCASVPQQWLNAAILRYGPKVPNGELKQLVALGLLRTSPVVSITALGATLLAYPDIQLLAPTVALAVSDGVFMAYWIAARSKLRAYPFILAGLLRSSLSLLLVATLLIADNDIAPSTILLACTVSSLIGTFALTLPHRPSESKYKPSAVQLHKWWSFGWPLIINYALGVTVLLSGKFLLMWLSTPKDVAQFAATFDTMFAIASLTIGFVGLTTVPRIFGTNDSHEKDVLLKHLRIISATAAFSIPLLLALGWPYIASLLIGPEMRLLDPIFLTTTAASLALMMYRFQYQNIAAQINGRTKFITTATGMGLAVNLLASVALIPLAGATGASVGILLGATTSLIVMSVNKHAVLTREETQ